MVQDPWLAAAGAHWQSSPLTAEGERVCHHSHQNRGSQNLICGIANRKLQASSIMPAGWEALIEF